MIARIVTVALSVAVTLLVPFILVVNCIRMATDEEFVRTVYDYGWVPEDRFGFTEQERERLALLGLRSIEPSTEEGVDLLREARLSNGEPAFNAREVAHMQDVRTAVSRAYQFQIIALVAIAILAVLGALLRTTRALIPVALARGAVLTVVLAAAAGILAFASYNAFETTFHGLFFEGDTWRFEEADTLRRLYPDRFWLDVAVAIGVAAVLQAAIVFFVAKLWAGRAGVRRPLRPRTESA